LDDSQPAVIQWFLLVFVRRPVKGNETMTVQLQSWEHQLLAWAYEARQTHTPHENLDRNNTLLQAAYRRCDEITKANSRTFYMASGLLPQDKRNAARALYAFCRVTDNIVDNNPSLENIRIDLDDWRERVTTSHTNTNDPVILAWADAQARYHIPHGYAEQLIDGVARDLNQKRYATFAELAEYSYGVASTVGLMAMHIIGFSSEEAIPYAVKLGVALQLTNILRDVAEDWRAGRLYLPQDELTAFGLGEDDVANGRLDKRWTDFMRFQIDRNRRLYDESLPGIRMLNADGRFAIAAAAELYRAILGDIEAHQCDVFSRRAFVPLPGKLARLPRIWWQSRGYGFV
jgi:15-cis-phytoene synthase